jgi:extracellular factor (EF) 3-hydroxypalmitic acid methyl ester biosynthesis protein
LPLETAETAVTDNQNPVTGLGEIKASLHDRIKIYKKRAREVEDYLLQNPDEWGRFQNEFNSEVNGIFREIMNYDKVNLANGQKDKVDKLKRIFINRIRELFLQSEYFERCLRKPYGYAGDFKIIDDMYQNDPTSSGFVRLIDNYFHMAAICIAVRNRKEDFKKIIAKFANDRKGRPIRIMKLGSGPCRDIKELFGLGMIANSNVAFDCYDNDEDAIKYAKKLLANNPKVNFIKENALRLAAARDIHSIIKNKYDIIYALGIFDYFNHKISVRLISNLKKLLKPGGIMAVSTARDRYSNPSLHCMEWVGEWIILYRTDEEFRKIFRESGFKEKELKVSYEQQGTMQYILATNTGK